MTPKLPVPWLLCWVRRWCTEDAELSADVKRAVPRQDLASSSRSRRAAAGRAQLLAKGRHIDGLQIPAQLRQFGIARDTAEFQRGNSKFCEIFVKFRRNLAQFDQNFAKFCEISVKMRKKKGQVFDEIRTILRGQFNFVLSRSSL